MTILWYCLSPVEQDCLVGYQRRHFRRKLELPNFEPGLVTAPLESTEEISRLIRLPPDHPAKVA